MQIRQTFIWETKIIKLENDLKVYLISDKLSSNSVAILKTLAGSKDEPTFIPGVAHYLEHSLFLGSEKFKKPDLLFEKTSMFSGSTNAFTSDEETLFFFNVKTAGFNETIQIWSDFFTSPSFPNEAMKLEVSAVDSEYLNDVSKITWREQFASNIMMNKNSLQSRFTIGTKETLLKYGFETLKNETISFFNSHYSSNTMSLVLFSNHELDVLEDLAKSYFSQIKNNNRTLTNYSKFPNFASNGFYSGHLIKFKNQKSKVLNLYFPCPQLKSLKKYGLSILLKYYLIGNHQYGFKSALHNLGLGSLLNAGLEFDDRDASLFKVRISLTNKGFSNPFKIAEIFFKYLIEIKNFGSNIFRWKQAQRFLLVKWKYSSPKTLMKELISATMNTRMMDDEFIFASDKIIEKFSKSLFLSYLNNFTPENCMFSISSPDYLETRKSNMFQNFKRKFSKGDQARQTFQKSNKKYFKETSFIENLILRKFNPIYQLNYDFIKLDEEFYKIMNREILLCSIGIALNPKNSYLPSDLSIVKIPGEHNKSNYTQDYFENPKCINCSDSSVTIHKTERRFNIPLTNILMDFYLQASTIKTAQDEVLLLMTKISILSISSFYLKEAKELGYKTTIQSNSLSFQLNGFSDKIEIYSKIFARALRFENNLFVSQKRNFLTLKIFLFTVLKNSNYQQVYLKCFKYMNEILKENSHSIKSLIQALRSTTIKNFQRFYNQILSKANFLIIGNILEEKSTILIQELKEIIFNQSTKSSFQQEINLKNSQAQNIRFPLSLLYKYFQQIKSSLNEILDISNSNDKIIFSFSRDHNISVADLKGQSFVYRTINNRKMDINSGILNCYQIFSNSPTNLLKISLINTFFNPEAFRFLRTKNQLGYIVFGFTSNIEGMINLNVLIQGSYHSPEYLNKKVSEFMFYFEEYLKNVSEEDFSKAKDSIKKQLTALPLNLKSESQQYSNFYFESNYNQGIKEEKLNLIKILDRITLLEIQKLFINEVRSNPGKLSIQIYSKRIGNQIKENLFGKSVQDNEYVGLQPKLIESEKTILESRKIVVKKRYHLL